MLDITLMALVTQSLLLAPNWPIPVSCD